MITNGGREAHHLGLVLTQFTISPARDEEIKRVQEQHIDKHLRFRRRQAS